MSLTLLIANSTTDNTMFTLKYLMVTTVFLLLLWFVSRYLIKRRGGFPSNSRIRVRERALLHGDTVVALVEVEGKNYIVASNKNSVTLLDVRDDLRSFEDTYSEAKAGIRLEQIGSLFKKKS